MIIGLTGSYCSGKDTVANYIVKNYEFIHFSLSDEIRLLMKKQGIEATRENLIKFGTQLREKNGNDVLAQSVSKKFEQDKNYCITLIQENYLQNLDELKAFINELLLRKNIMNENNEYNNNILINNNNNNNQYYKNQYQQNKNKNPYSH